MVSTEESVAKDRFGGIPEEKPMAKATSMRGLKMLRRVSDLNMGWAGAWRNEGRTGLSDAFRWSGGRKPVRVGHSIADCFWFFVSRYW